VPTEHAALVRERQMCHEFREVLGQVTYVPAEPHADSAVLKAIYRQVRGSWSKAPSPETIA
jgi:hypothetical protein